MRAPDPPAAGSHYPSWGSKTHVTETPASDAIVLSLPLMGIENALIYTFSRTRARLLITPHGDRKPVRSPPSDSPPAAHYPSWGSKTGPCRATANCRSAWTHYPSWGSKTLAVQRCACSPTTNSLPLMGIENFLRPVTTSAIVSTASLPLMGIENFSNSARIGSGGWTHYPSWGSKTARRMAAPASISSSLPLMGIENCGRPCPARTATTPHYPSWGSKTLDMYDLGRKHAELITPHGDRKRDFCPSERIMVSLITPHGDRKRGRNWRRGHQVILLITPHGDRKPAGSQWMRPSRTSHYPSWGSKTSGST